MSAPYFYEYLPSSFHGLARLVNLRILNISYADKLTAIGFRWINALTNLTSLNVNRCSSLEPRAINYSLFSSIHHGDAFSYLRGLPLTDLMIDRSSSFTYNTISEIATLTGMIGFCSSVP